jgi:hypothetical protein
MWMTDECHTARGQAFCASPLPFGSPVMVRRSPRCLSPIGSAPVSSRHTKTLTPTRLSCNAKVRFRKHIAAAPASGERIADEERLSLVCLVSILAFAASVILIAVVMCGLRTLLAVLKSCFTELGVVSGKES